MSTLVLPAPSAWARLRQALSTALYRRRNLYLLLLLLPPLLWFGIVYLGSLFALLMQSFYALDDFSGQVVPQFTLSTWRDLLSSPANLDIVLRTASMALAVTIACALMAFPIAYYMARYASGKVKAFFYLAIMLPLWANYLVRVYAWKIILAKEGVIAWTAQQLGLDGLLQALLATPGIGGQTLSTSYFGMFLVFSYLWLPYMILPIQAALERVPESLLHASADLGATPAQTFRTVLLPLALPGVIAGSIFTFSLTLGDYVVPYLVGTSAFFIGQAVYVLQGASGNIPLAAAFSVLPVVIIAVYLVIAKRMGAFDAL
ncbi:ABC transporter permease [Permianibacter sp. IMCC34836]|uniref:ABC transporter permease n=1 Tax=Permianibacter fluminis TaxID=2738515 RepID=UPI00155565A7|nr:ABC transporter permease [Permianibacter fluminis]NQD37285.1 ABC transporter permease [Permianibacter fluminis]